VEEWESPQHFQDAMRGVSPQLRAPTPFTAYPVLYEVVAE
jgi:hypothetical protein